MREPFYRQGTFMADFEDDCPYPGTFNSDFPTYNAMSDRQLRGYFTWRAAVRQGDVQESCLSFAYVYLYELICGIGVTDPMDGFQKLESFWQAYRTFSPEIDRYARTWLQDYVVYHGLSPQLLEPYKTLSFDRSLVALTRAEELACARLTNPQRGRRKKGASALPLPGDPVAEQRLFDALDALSTYHLAGSRLYKSKPTLRHVCCAVFVRMSEYYHKQRKYSLTESLFGGQFELAYTMFGSAVFFNPSAILTLITSLTRFIGIAAATARGPANAIRAIARATPSSAKPCAPPTGSYARSSDSTALLRSRASSPSTCRGSSRRRLRPGSPGARRMHPRASRSTSRSSRTSVAPPQARANHS